MKLWIDIESRSSVPIKYGAMAYAQRAEVIMWQWAVDDGLVHVDEELTRQLILATNSADEIWAHNAEFDRTVIEEAIPYWNVPWDKWRCTAALARMHGLPGGLDKLCTIFKLPTDKAKDQRGYWLIRLFCIPRKDGEYNDKTTHPKEWQEFREYGDQDVVAMREVHRKLPKWNATPRMWAVWHLDQRMNAQGVAMDLELAAGAIKAMERADRQMRKQCIDITDGEVESTTQRDKLLNFISTFYDVHLPDLKADTVEKALEDESLPEHLKELLRVRQQASKASTAKYKRVLTHHVGGRLRNLLVYCGAARTGRWSGRTFQPQNLPRPKYAQWDIDEAISRFRTGSIFAYAPDDVPGLASSALRGLIIASKGRRLVVSDFANIEGRAMAWVAGERWKLLAFASFDAGTGPDLYKIAYARAFNIQPGDIGDDDPRRQIGKVMELALQYYGGVGAFCSMAQVYGLDLDDLAAKGWATIPGHFKVQAKNDREKAIRRRRTYGLDERIWLVCHALVLMWRAAHPAIVRFWYRLDEACALASRHPGSSHQVGAHIAVDRQQNWLRIKLPSGRYLCYPSPKQDDYSSSFLGVDPYTRQWKRISTYSGKRTENIVQAVAADHMMDGLIAADEAGYNPILSVHDEAITEPPDDDRYNDKHLSQLLVESSLWADGVPLAAKGMTIYTYRK